MGHPILEIENVSKKYQIGTYRGYLSLREEVVKRFSPKRRKAESAKGVFWALKNVNFSISEGEAVGIIGRNGAGKSTLLKILSRITPPTEGRIRVHGRVASLLEVGTGFHPELTGRENIFLNGAILGMTRMEIRKKFDEIVAFAEIDKFIDTPVKRFSSGMYVRLAFAVAAFLEPEILLVDEVLAVGDAQFQKKCLGRMSEVTHGGRTVLFVSHQMAAIEGLCSQVVLLDEGRVVGCGPSKQIIDQYLNQVLPAVVERSPLADRSNRRGNGRLRLTNFRLEDENGRTLLAVRSGMTFDMVLDYCCESGTPASNVDVGISISNMVGQQLAVFYSSFTGQVFDDIPRYGEFRCRLHRLALGPNRYMIGARVTVAGLEADWPRDFIGFLDVEAGDYYGTGAGLYHPTNPVLLDGSWRVEGREDSTR